MSFRDSAYGNKQPRQRREAEDSSFERTIKANIQEMQDSVRLAGERLQRGLLSRRSIEGLDEHLGKSRGLAQETEQAFRDWTIHLASEPTERHRKKFSYEKLQKAFEQEVVRLKEVAQQAVAKQQDARATEQQKDQCMDDCFDLEEQGLLDDAGSLPQSMDQSVQNRVAREREEGIRRIQSQVCEVNQIVRDLASICSEQGQQLCTIEEQAQDASTHTRQAVVQLKAASERQKSTRERLCCVLAAMLVVLCFLLLPHMHWLSHPGSTPLVVSRGDSDRVTRAVEVSDEGTLATPWGYETGARVVTKQGHSLAF